jgi:mono/diheme cytochrome c family protein
VAVEAAITEVAVARSGKTQRAGLLARLVIGAALAASVLAPGEANADAALFKESCAKCHSRAASLAKGLKGATPAEKAAALDRFLASHHAEDEVRRRRLVDYLVGLASK